MLVTKYLLRIPKSERYEFSDLPKADMVIIDAKALTHKIEHELIEQIVKHADHKAPIYLFGVSEFEANKVLSILNGIWTYLIPGNETYTLKRLIWYDPQDMKEEGKWKTAHEVIYAILPDGWKANFQWSDVIVEPGISEDRKLMPEDRPVSIYQRLISNSIDQGKTIYEIGCGSGNGLLASWSLGMNWVGFESRKEYSDALAKRIQPLTGLTGPNEKYEKLVLEIQ